MLVRDVFPMLSEGYACIVDDLDNEIWSGMRRDVAKESGILPLNVTLVDYDTLNDQFVIWVENRDDHFHDIELLLSDCLRCADEGGLSSYVTIMHESRKVAQIAETGFAEAIGR